MIRIPFSLLPEKVLIRLSFIFKGLSELISKRFKFLEKELRQAEFKISAEEYLARSLTAISFLFIFLSLILSLIFVKFGYKFTGILIAAVISFFAILHQIKYPKLMANRRVREIDKNLLSALRTILIQINSGVSLFDVFVSISKSDYGEVSKIFNKLVKKVNTGTPQIEALEDVVQNNPSPFFRKSIWQLINGMKSGSDINNVLRNITNSLSKEQLVQIENYGSQLSPLAMFYMLLVIIIPSLGITFITVISSFFSSVALDGRFVLMVFFVLVLIFQVMFLGMIKTKRPSLLEE